MKDIKKQKEGLAPSFIKVSDFCKLAGITHQRVSQLCRGYTQKKNGRAYNLPAKWKQGKDWKYIEGNMCINKKLLKN